MMLKLLLVSTLALAFNIQPVKAEPRTWTVDDDGPADFNTIQDAIKNSSVGDTVFVHIGVYYENVVINKSILLVGENRSSTIIYGNRTSTIVYVNADNVQICSFTIEGNGSQIRGIYLEYSRNGTIKENYVKNSGFYGILLDRSDACNVGDNIVNNVTNGISIVVSRNCNISKNQISDCYYGLSLLDTGVCFLRQNNMTNNQRNFKVTGITVTDFIHDIDFSNTINGKPICYLVNQHDKLVSTNVSFVGVINSTNITVENSEISHNMWGIILAYTDNSLIRNVTLTLNDYGIRMLHSKYCIISESNVTNNSYIGIALDHSNNCHFLSNNMCNSRSGIYLRNSDYCTISRNYVNTNGTYGMYLENCSYCIISENKIENNYDGIALHHSNCSSIYHNMFLNNTKEAYCHDSTNNWDNGFEGNFWSNYDGADTDYDGIGNSHYEIDENNIDQHPLMGMFLGFNTPYGYQVNFISNSSISDIEFGLIDSFNATLTFNVTGDAETRGFCRICIPKVLINGSYIVRFNGVINYSQVRELSCSNETYEYLYINYSHDKQRIEISGTTMIPEFPLFIIMPMLMIATILAVISYKRRHSN